MSGSNKELGQVQCRGLSCRLIHWTTRSPVEINQGEGCPGCGEMVLRYWSPGLHPRVRPVYQNSFRAELVPCSIREIAEGLVISVPSERTPEIILGARLQPSTRKGLNNG